MMIARQTIWLIVALAGMILSGSAPASYGQAPAVDEATSRSYFADTSLFSINPKQGISTYRGYGAGGVGPNGTFGTSMSRHRGTQQFEITLSGREKAGRFLVKLSVNSVTKDQVVELEDLKRELDLTDLQPQMIEIARDDDGRLYRLTVTPRVIEQPLPKAFRTEDLQLDHWSFNGSSVILNDQDYLGTLGMSSGKLAWVDVPGVGLVEFSLLPFKDARTEGVLKNGTLTIEHGKTSLQINNVLNGRNREILAGGPYRVFVRWKPSSQTIEEYRQTLRKLVQNLKQQAESGDSNVSQDALARLEKMADSDRVLLISSGMGPISKEDLDDRRP